MEGWNNTPLTHHRTARFRHEIVLVRRERYVGLSLVARWRDLDRVRDATGRSWRRQAIPTSSLRNPTKYFHAR